VKAQTLGWEMRYVYMALPIAFALMTIRILQVNYLKLVKGIDPRDPDKVEVEEMLELALVENIQRADINAIDRAKAYCRLKDEFSLDQEAISAAVGKSRTSVTNTLRLLSLPGPVQDLITEGKLSEGHGRALLALGAQSAIQQAANYIIIKGLSVRETEALVKRLSNKSQAVPVQSGESRDPNLTDLESRLSISLGTRIKIHAGVTEKSRGYLQIDYYGLEDLNRLTSQLLGE